MKIYKDENGNTVIDGEHHVTIYLNPGETAQSKFSVEGAPPEDIIVQNFVFMYQWEQQKQ